MRKLVAKTEKQTLGGVLKPSKSKEFLLEALAISKEIGSKRERQQLTQT